MNKIRLVQAYIKERKGVDVFIFIESDRDVVLLNYAHSVAYEYFYKKPYMEIILK